MNQVHIVIRSVAFEGDTVVVVYLDNTIALEKADELNEANNLRDVSFYVETHQVIGERQSCLFS